MKKLLFLLATIIVISNCSLIPYNLVNPYEQYERNGVSVFYLHPKPISKDFYSPVTVIYKGETYEAEGKIRGGQTALYPKKSYTLKFSDDKLFTDPDNADFEDKKKIILTANFDDHSHIRNRLAYWFWNQMVAENLNNGYTIKSSSAEVFTNGAYEGLYTLAEFIDETYLEINELVNSIPTGGELFKGSTNDVKFFLSDDPLAGFEKKIGYPEEGDEGAFDSLDSFIININTLGDADFATYFTSNANVDSYYDWWFLVSYLQAWDSTGKNSYHYLPPGSGMEWHFIPWDFNASFGQKWNTEREDNDFDPTYVEFQGIFDRLILHPSFKTVARDSDYSDLIDTGGNLELSDILAKVDSLQNEIDLAAEADYEKWNSTYRDFYVWDHRDDYNTFDEEIQYIKDWITAQHALFMAEY